jgi:hypothetical protein
MDVTDKTRSARISQRVNCGHALSGKVLEIALVFVNPKAGRPIGMMSNLKGSCETLNTSNGPSQNEDSVSFWRISCSAAGRVKGSTDGTYRAASYRKAQACVWFRLRICCLNGFSFFLIGNGGWAIKRRALARSAICRGLAGSSRKIAQCPCL